MMTASAPLVVTHGCPWDRGAADAYYGRPARPHKRIHKDGLDYDEYLLTDPDEIQEYYDGYETRSSGEKDWR